MDFVRAFRVAQLIPLVGIIYFFSDNLSNFVLYALNYIKGNVFDLLLVVQEAAILTYTDYNLFFLAVLCLRYFRLAVNTYGYLFMSQPEPIPTPLKVTSDRAHVIIPSVEPTNSDFLRCVMSVLEKRPGWITIVTANAQQTAQAQDVIDSIPVQDHTQLSVTTGPMANKRHQLSHVLRGLAANREANEDVIVVFVDDHVWWPSPLYLSAILAPFANPKVGIASTHKQPERNRGSTFADSLLNFIACLYLERHNFEVASSNAIDGSAFVVSGRTCAIRASIVMREDFIDGFVDERFFFGMFGPLNPDDDNYITRYIIRNGWEIKWQNQPEALMETSLGVSGGYKKFSGQINRWARSQWRSNPRSVFFDRSVWRRGYFWGGFVHCASFFNFALLWDPLIVYSWYHSDYTKFTIYHVVLLILGSKFIKVAPFFYRNPQDLWLFPFQVLFGYLHSWVKFWALVTFYDHSWGGRNLAAVQVEAANDDDSPPSPGNQDADINGGENSDDSGRNRHNSGKGKGPAQNCVSPPRSSPEARGHGSVPRSGSRSAQDTFTNSDNHNSANSMSFRGRNGSKSILHLTPANAREGQYMNSYERNHWGTPRSLTSSTRSVHGSNATSIGYNADDEGSRDRPQDTESSSWDTIVYPEASDNITTPPHQIRTHYYPSVPDAPRKSSIVFKKTSPLFKSFEDAAKKVEPLRVTVIREPKFTYARDFPRGDDCQRTHPDGTWLSSRRSSSGMRRCRSPEPGSRAVLPGRSRY